VDSYGVVDFSSSQAYNPSVVCPEIADNRHRAKLPENQFNIALSRQNGKLINGCAACARR
jgi:hypothetical protein